MSGRGTPEIVVTWERRLGRDRSAGWVKDNGLAIWHRMRRGWRLAFQIHETPLEETTVGHCAGEVCYRSDDGDRTYTNTHVILVGHEEMDVDSPVTSPPDNQFIRPKPAELTSDRRPDLFVVQDSSGSGGVSIYRVITWDVGYAYQRFRRVHGDGCIVPAGGGLLMRASVYRRGDSHCCPTFFRYSQLAYRPRKFGFVRVRSELVRLPRDTNPEPLWTSRLATCDE